MDVALFCVAVLLLAAFVAAPLYRRSPAPSGPQRGGSGPLDARRQALESALDDLETDRTSGLLDDPSYERERQSLQAEVARLSDSLGAAPTAHRPSPTDISD